MQMQNEILPELFLLLDRLAAIGRNVREKDSMNNNDNTSGLTHDDQQVTPEVEVNND